MDRTGLGLGWDLDGTGWDLDRTWMGLGWDMDGTGIGIPWYTMVFF